MKAVEEALDSFTAYRDLIHAKTLMNANSTIAFRFGFCLLQAYTTSPLMTTQVRRPNTFIDTPPQIRPHLFNMAMRATRKGILYIAIPDKTNRIIRYRRRVSAATALGGPAKPGAGRPARTSRAHGEGSGGAEPG